jgi:hypothetical protein
VHTNYVLNVRIKWQRNEKIGGVLCREKMGQDHWVRGLSQALVEDRVPEAAEAGWAGLIQQGRADNVLVQTVIIKLLMLQGNRAAIKSVQNAELN